MTTIRFPSVDHVRAELRCSSCGYSLRGMGEGEIRCPECGRSGDLRTLVLAAWGDRWHKAPWFQRLRVPSGLFAITVVLVALLAGANERYVSDFYWALPAALLIAWATVLARSHDLLVDLRMFAALAVLHAIFLAYVALIIVVACAGLLLPIAVINDVMSFWTLGLAATLIVALGVLRFALRSERFIARRLARHLMAQWSEVDTMSS